MHRDDTRKDTVEITGDPPNPRGSIQDLEAARGRRTHLLPSAPAVPRAGAVSRGAADPDGVGANDETLRAAGVGEEEARRRGVAHDRPSGTQHRNQDLFDYDAKAPRSVDRSDGHQCGHPPREGTRKGRPLVGARRSATASSQPRGERTRMRRACCERVASFRASTKSRRSPSFERMAHPPACGIRTSGARSHTLPHTSDPTEDRSRPGPDEVLAEPGGRNSDRTSRSRSTPPLGRAQRNSGLGSGRRSGRRGIRSELIASR